LRRGVAKGKESEGRHDVGANLKSEGRKKFDWFRNRKSSSAGLLVGEDRQSAPVTWGGISSIQAITIEERKTTQQEEGGGKAGSLLLNKSQLI